MKKKTLIQNDLNIQNSVFKIQDDQIDDSLLQLKQGYSSNNRKQQGNLFTQNNSMSQLANKYKQYEQENSDLSFDFSQELKSTEKCNENNIQHNRRTQYQNSVQKSIIKNKLSQSFKDINNEEQDEESQKQIILATKADKRQLKKKTTFKDQQEIQISKDIIYNEINKNATSNNDNNNQLQGCSNSHYLGSQSPNVSIINSQKKQSFFNGNSSRIDSVYTSQRRRRINTNQKFYQNFVPFMMVVTYVKIFMNNITNRLRQKVMYQNLTEQQLNIIGDNAHQFYNENGQEEINQKFYLMIKTFIKTIIFLPVINPRGKLRMFLNLYHSVIILIRMFYTTIKLSFFLFNIQESVHLIREEFLVIINISHFLLIFLEFNTGYINNGMIISDRKLITRNYIKSEFWSDLIAHIPMILGLLVNSFQNENFNIIYYISEIFIFFKYKALNKSSNLVERYLNENFIGFSRLYPLLQLVARVLFVAHIVGLFWQLIAQIEIQYFDSSKTWLHSQNLVDAQWLSIYNQSLYWAVSTMATILLYLPETELEILFSTFAIFLCAGVFGYAVGIIGYILNDINKQNAQFKQDLQLMNRYLQRNKIDRELKQRILLYLEFIHQQGHQKNLEEQEQALALISPALRQNIKSQIYQDTLSKFDLLDNFSQKTIQNTTQILKEELFSIGSEINVQKFNNEKIYYKMYYIQSGQVEMYFKIDLDDKIQKVKIKSLQKGDVFGQKEFLTKQTFQVFYEATEQSILHSIDSVQFEKIIERNTDDYEHFCQLKDDFIFNNDESYENLMPKKCAVCFKNHVSANCNVIQYIPNLKKIFYEYNNLGTQIRQIGFQRYRQIKEDCALSIVNEINEIINFLDEQIDETGQLYQAYKQFYQVEQQHSQLDEPSQISRQKQYQMQQIQNQQQQQSQQQQQQLKLIKKRSSNDINIYNNNNNHYSELTQSLNSIINIQDQNNLLCPQEKYSTQLKHVQSQQSPYKKVNQNNNNNNPYLLQQRSSLIVQKRKKNSEDINSKELFSELSLPKLQSSMYNQNQIIERLKQRQNSRQYTIEKDKTQKMLENQLKYKRESVLFDFNNNIDRTIKSRPTDFPFFNKKESKIKSLQKVISDIESQLATDPKNNYIKNVQNQNESLIYNKFEWDLQSFDKLKNYKIYLPHNNLDKILQFLDQKWAQNLEEFQHNNNSNKDAISILSRQTKTKQNKKEEIKISQLNEQIKQIKQKDQDSSIVSSKLLDLQLPNFYVGQQVIKTAGSIPCSKDSKENIFNFKSKQQNQKDENQSQNLQPSQQITSLSLQQNSFNLKYLSSMENNNKNYDSLRLGNGIKGKTNEL